jgi:hypothetical protein
MSASCNFCQMILTHAVRWGALNVVDLCERGLAIGERQATQILLNPRLSAFVGGPNDFTASDGRGWWSVIFQPRP